MKISKIITVAFEEASESKNMSPRSDLRPRSHLYAKINHFMTYLVMNLSSYYNDTIINIFFLSISTPSAMTTHESSRGCEEEEIKNSIIFHQKFKFKKVFLSLSLLNVINDYLYRDDKSTIYNVAECRRHRHRIY